MALNLCLQGMVVSNPPAKFCIVQNLSQAFIIFLLKHINHKASSLPKISTPGLLLQWGHFLFHAQLTVHGVGLCLACILVVGRQWKHEVYLRVFFNSITGSDLTDSAASNACSQFLSTWWQANILNCIPCHKVSQQYFRKGLSGF